MKSEKFYHRVRIYKENQIKVIKITIIEIRNLSDGLKTRGDVTAARVTTAVKWKMRKRQITNGASFCSLRSRNYETEAIKNTSQEFFKIDKSHQAKVLKKSPYFQWENKQTTATKGGKKNPPATCLEGGNGCLTSERRPEWDPGCCWYSAA